VRGHYRPRLLIALLLPRVALALRTLGVGPEMQSFFFFGETFWSAGDE